MITPPCSHIHWLYTAEKIKINATMYQSKSHSKYRIIHALILSVVVTNINYQRLKGEKNVTL